MYMIVCDCHEREDTDINSWKQFEELKSFFHAQVKQGVFVEVPVEKPFYAWHDASSGKEMRWYADKWYTCLCCGTLWEIDYPEFPARGFVRKLLLSLEQMTIPIQEDCNETTGRC